MAIREHLQSVQAGYDGLIRRDANPKDVVICLDLRHPHQANRSLMFLQVHCREGRAIAGFGWSTDWRWTHHVVVDRLELVANGGTQLLRGSMIVQVATPDLLAKQGKVVPLTLTLDATVTGHAVAGSYRAEPAAGLEEFRSGPLSEAPAPVKPNDPGLKTAEAPTLSALCLAWEQQAEHLAARIRALEHARLVSQPLAGLIAQHPARIYERPDFKVAAAKVPAEEAEGPAAEDLEPEAITRKTPQRKAVDTPAVLAHRASVAAQIAQHLARLAKAITTQVELGTRSDAVASGTMTTDDPEFGPWFGFAPLPERDGRVNVVPDDAGAEGPPCWLNVEHWRILGPWRDMPFVPLHLPELIDSEECTCPVLSNHEKIMSGTSIKSQVTTPASKSWQPQPCEPGNGTVRPPQHTAPRGHELDLPGLNDATFTFASTIYAPREIELWAGIMVDDLGMLWVNERLVWNQAEAASNSIESISLLKLRLRKGTNTILVRLDNRSHSTGMWLRLCVRGQPRSKAAAAAAMATVAQRAATLAARDDGLRGWRGRWNGEYPEAHPPVAWDLDKGINVRWRIPLPWSKAMPVISGDRIFITREPCFLVCLDKSTGTVLWEGMMNILELSDPVAFQASEALRKTWQEAEARLAGLPANAGPDQIKPLRGEARKAQAAWWDHIVRTSGIIGGSHWGNYFGHCFATPVTDGTYIYVKSAAGVTACFDRDGKRRWMVKTDYFQPFANMCSSPVLAEGRLVMELATREPGLSEGICKAEPTMRLVGLDAATGAVAWEVKPSYDLQNASSPAPVTLTNGTEDMTVVITGGGRGPVMRADGVRDVIHLGGTVVRARDGKVLISNLSTNSGWSSPLVIGDHVYHIGPFYSTCYRLVMVDRDQVGAIRMWTQDTTVHDGGLVRDGDMLIGLDGGQWPSRIHCYDLATGQEFSKKVNTATIIFGKYGRGYCPPSRAGDHVFISDDGTRFGEPALKVRMAVFQSGRDGRLVARNRLDPDIIPSPVFDGDCMYVRSTSHVTCIGLTGDAGRAYEATVVAETLMEDLPPAPPAAGEARALAALPKVQVRPAPFTVAPAEVPWNMVGPVAADKADNLLAAIGGPTLAGYDPGKKAGSAAAPDPKGVSDVYMDRWNDRKFVVRGNTLQFDLTAPINLQPKTAVIYYCCLELDQPRTIRVVADQVQADFWISGEKAAAGDRLQLAAGRHVLMLRYLSDEEPSRVLMSLRLELAIDPEQERNAWRKAVQDCRPLLERAIRLAPDSEAARQAKARLAQL